jgi:hypothetical protein
MRDRIGSGMAYKVLRNKQREMKNPNRKDLSRQLRAAEIMENFTTVCYTKLLYVDRSITVSGTKI